MLLRSGLPHIGMTLAIVAFGLTGCGGGSAATTSTSAHARTAKIAPSYRAGQYCTPANEAKYHAAGFECKKHHLAHQ